MLRHPEGSEGQQTAERTNCSSGECQGAGPGSNQHEATADAARESRKRGTDAGCCCGAPERPELLRLNALRTQVKWHGCEGTFFYWFFFSVTVDNIILQLQIYSIVVRQLHNLVIPIIPSFTWCHTVITPPVTIFPVLYFTSPFTTIL